MSGRRQGPATRLAIGVCVAILATSSATHGQLLGRLTEEEEIELGRLAAEEMEKDLVLLTDAAVTEYVSDLGETLARQSQRSELTYVFKVVDTDEINAFALPGGFIYVHRGLIEAATNESELAGVLGHEIAHVVARHGAEQAQRASIANLGLRVLGSILGQGTGGQLGAVAAQMAAAGTFMKFSRDAEREADRLGAENVAAGGYDPQGMISFFEKLAGLRERQANAVDQFFASHPSPAERVSNIQDLVGRLSDGRSLSEDSARFRSVKTRLERLPPAPTAALPATETDEVARNAEPEVSTETAAADLDPVPPTYAGVERDRAVAARFAPVFRQALGSSPRYDYITRFDFDGDWRGDNNWDNAANRQFALEASVYFNVSETHTHFFIHYGVFHPRDYKGGNVRGVVLSEILREGASRHGDYDPTGLAESAVLAHENDMEGALVVVRKPEGDLDGARVVYVETLAHNQFLRYTVSRGLSRFLGRGEPAVMLEDEHPVLYIEPKGHGIEAWEADRHRADEDTTGFVVYRHHTDAQEPSGAVGEEEVGYTLEPIPLTIWPRAQRGQNLTYGGSFDYRVWTVQVGDDLAPSSHEVTLGELGSMFRGTVGGRHMARPPWGWFDRDEQDRRQGEWFLQPAETIQLHFAPDPPFSLTYVHHPALGVYREP